MRGTTSDAWAVALAAATMVGAYRARAVPVAVFVGVAVLVAVVRRPMVLCLAFGLVASLLGARSWAGILGVPTSGYVRERVEVVNDPERVGGSVRIELRLAEGSRVQATAEGDAAAVLERALAGERVDVTGTLGQLRGRSRSFLHRRHIGARLAVRSAIDLHAGGPVSRFANQLRRTLVEGAASMPADRRALFTGIVLGDDREQSATEIDDFRAAGLTHLLAVSGQNVAFVMVIVAPLLRRLGLRHRVAVGMSVLAVFGVLTRWEPSVLRAVAMAGIALLASSAGRRASPIRILALAVTGLVLIDPMLVRSVGFLLSSGACFGIALIGPRLEARGVPAALAVTLSAQVGVAPVLIPVFGGMPLASLPANLLAVPAAGPLMVWGLAAGLPAGLLGGTTASLLHLPSRALLAWIAWVARWGANLPLPEVGQAGAVAAVAGAIVIVVARWHRRTVAVVAVIGLVSTGAAVVRPPSDAFGKELAPGAELWRSGNATVVSVGGRIDEGRLLTGLRRARVRRIDILVVRSAGGTSAALAATVRHRAAVRAVVAPDGNSVAGARTAVTGQRYRAGNLEVTIVAGRPRWRPV